MAAALDHQLDDNDAWLPARRHTDDAVEYRAGAPKAPPLAARCCNALSEHCNVAFCVRASPEHIGILWQPESWMSECTQFSAV